MRNFKKILFLITTLILVLSLSPKIVKAMSYEWYIELIQNESDYNGDDIPDIISTFTIHNNTFLEIYVNDTREIEEEYKWKSVICNISGFDKIEKWEYNPDTEIWTSTGLLNYQDLQFSHPGWCSDTGQYGFLLYGSGSGDKQYMLNFTEGEKTLKIYTGSSSEIIKAKSTIIPDIQYLTLPADSTPMGVVYDNIETTYVASYWRGSIFAINTSTLEYEEYFVTGSENHYLGVEGLTIDSSGNVWFTERRKGIGKFNPVTKTFEEFSINGSKPHQIVYSPSDGNLWFTNQPYLSKINPSSEEITDYYVGGEAMTLSLDSNGNIWFSRLEGSIGRFNITSEELFEVVGFDRPIGVFVNGSFVFVAENSLSSECGYDKNGTVAIYNIGTEEITRVNTTIITDEGPYMVYGDVYGNVWFTDISKHIGRIGYSDGASFIEKVKINNVSGVSFSMTEVEGSSIDIWFSGQGSSFIGMIETGPFDFDDDGIPDKSDNCPSVPNPGQEGSDSDGIGDACDNCWYIENPDQSDSDNNCPSMPYTTDPFCGDVCQDSDNDGILDVSDACSFTSGKADYQGCPVGDKNFVELHIIDRTKTTCDGAGSCKLLIGGALVKVFDRNDPDFQASYTKNPQGTSYPDIFDNNIGKVGSCTTDSFGKCIAGEEATGDYLVIVKYTDESGKIAYTGKPKSPNDFEDTDDDGIGDLAYKDFQVIKVINKDGTINLKAGSKTVITGSMLEVISPQYVIWESDQELYPFIFTSDSNWEVDVCVYVPEGYVVVEGGCTQVFVSGETKIVTFTLVDLQSPPPHIKTEMRIKHKDRTKKLSLDIPGKRKGKGKEKVKDQEIPFVLAGMFGLTTIGFIKKKRKKNL